MRKIWILLVVLCMLAGSFTVSAENNDQTDTISLDETKAVTIPDLPFLYNFGSKYFQQDFEFVAPENGIYRFVASCEEDESRPYNFYMNVRYWTEDPSRQNGENGYDPGYTADMAGFWAFDYLELENGIEFDGWAGETYRLRFVYPENDGRHPEFSLSLVHGDLYYREDTLSFNETKVFSVPQPEGEVDPNRIYFTQDFIFVPEKSRTCRVLISCGEDGSDPCSFSLEKCVPYKNPLKNGDEIEVTAGEPIHLRFQYPIHDGRYPEFTIRITHNRDPIQAGMILYPGIVILACLIAVIPPIRRRKKNT